ncbi:MAG: hypothetical protein IKO57_07220 [Treponema sp.]|nr:hypothetical protein [bacterium]MBR4630216.1 hypothetical protein [Treponema sp.]
MLFTADIFEIVEKFSSDIQIIDRERHQVYTLTNLDKATSDEIDILKDFEATHLRCEDRHVFTNYEELENY